MVQHSVRYSPRGAGSLALGYGLALVMVTLAVLPSPALAQGCSDAGFCTLHKLKPDRADTGAGLASVRAGSSYGKAKHGITAWGGFVEYGRSIAGGFAVTAKATFAALSGPAASTSGLADLFLSASRSSAGGPSATIGLKIPLDNADASLAGLPLPMDYQTSTGTTDLIAGVGYDAGRTALAAAVQVPLSQGENAFLRERYPAGSPFRVFFSTNRFERKPDAFVRASHEIPLGDRWSFTPGILPILHLGDDEFTDSAGVVRSIDGSGGLTLNGSFFLRYRAGTEGLFELNLGAPFISRDAIPDGLTRSYVIGLEYRRTF